jgi:hypothetical protein
MGRSARRMAVVARACLEWDNAERAIARRCPESTAVGLPSAATAWMVAGSSPRKDHSPWTSSARKIWPSWVATQGQHYRHTRVPVW